MKAVPGLVLEKQRRQKKFLEALERGATIGEACKEVPVSYSTYSKWRVNEGQVWTDRVAQAQEFYRKHNRSQGEAIVDALGAEVDHKEMSFADFRRRFFGFHTPWVHERMAEILEKSPPGSVSMIEIHPEAGKTTNMADWISKKLAYDPNFRILYLSKSQKDARKRLQRIKRRMTDKDMAVGIREFQRVFGPFYVEGQEKLGKPWSADYLTVYKSDHDEQDYSLEALGFTGQIYGARADLIIMDDVQTMANINLTEKMMALYSQDIATRIGTRGRIVIVGTSMPFYEALIANGQITEGQLVSYPAIMNGEPLVPFDPETGFGFTMEALQTIRARVGEETWWRAYMMQPQAGPGATFTEHMVEMAKKMELNIRDFAEYSRYQDEQRIVTLDPALGGGNAIVAMGLTQETLRVYDCQKDFNLGRNEEIYERLETFVRRYRPARVVVETSALQKGLARSDQLLELARTYGFDIREHNTGTNKLDPVLGVREMAGSFNRGEIILPWGDDHTAARMGDLVAQLLAWRPYIPTRLLTQDLVMAMWFGWLYWMETRKQQAIDLAQWRARGVPYKEPIGPTGGMNAVHVGSNRLSRNHAAQFRYGPQTTNGRHP